MLFLALLSLCASAFAADNPLLVAFEAALAAEQAQSELSLLPDSERTYQEQQEMAQKWRQALAQAETERRRISPELPAWQQEVMRGKRLPSSSRKEALEFLRLSFPTPRRLPAQAWPLMRRWFGRETTETFLQESFATAQLPKLSAPKEQAPVRLVWVLDPYRKLPAAGSPLTSQEIQQSDRRIETVEVTPFPQLEDQAEGLHLALTNRSEEPYVLVSNGHASAVVFKMLDLYPALRFRQQLLGWINVDGNLFGLPPPAEGRRPAAISRTEGIDATLALRKQRLEAYAPPAPLGAKGFPILNLVSREKSQKGEVRDALVGEADTRFVSDRPAWRAVPDALPLLRPTTTAGSF